MTISRLKSAYRRLPVPVRLVLLAGMALYLWFAVIGMAIMLLR